MHSKVIRNLAFTSFAFISMTTFPALATTIGHITVDKVEDQTVHFKRVEASTSDSKWVPSPLKTKIFGLEVLGFLGQSERVSEKTPPYLLISGYDCADCVNKNEKKFLFLARADGAELTKLVHPGSVRLHNNQRLVFEGRAFLGQCLPGQGPVFVHFQREAVDRRAALQPSVFIATPTPEGPLTEKLIIRRRPNVETALKSVRKGSCVEIAGIHRKSIDFSIKFDKKKGREGIAEIENAQTNLEKQSPSATVKN